MIYRQQLEIIVFSIKYTGCLDLRLTNNNQKYKLLYLAKTTYNRTNCTWSFWNNSDCNFNVIRAQIYTFITNIIAVIYNVTRNFTIFLWFQTFFSKSEPKSAKLESFQSYFFGFTKPDISERKKQSTDVVRRISLASEAANRACGECFGFCALIRCLIRSLYDVIWDNSEMSWRLQLWITSRRVMGKEAD